MKADAVVAPGVTYEVDCWAEWYYGTWPALRAAGPVPKDLTAAPASRRGGAWVKDMQGRGWRVMHWGGEEFRLSRSFSKRERTERERDHELAERRSKALERVQLIQSLTEEDLREQLLRFFSIWHECIMSLALPAGKPGAMNPGRFRFTPSFREEANELFSDLRDLICQAEIVEDQQVLKAARRDLNALTDPAFRRFMQTAESQPGHLR